MKALSSVREIRVYYERAPNERILVGRLAYAQGAAAFEYDPSFRALGLELSPFRMALEHSGLLRARPDRFEGLFGLFDDSLPDGWGRLLLDRHIEALGGQRELLTPLDRLAWVGARGVGALTYEPEHPLSEKDGLIDLHALGKEMEIVLEDGASAALEQLLNLGGSPQGARPKALVLVSKDGHQIQSGLVAREGFEPYLVKFAAKSDPRGAAGPIELAYNRMAAASGVNVPEARLLGATAAHPGYFAVRRFDRRGDRRIHCHTLSGLIEAQPGVTFTSYDEALKVAWLLTRDARAVKELFRRSAFNVFGHNRDDHARNISFLMAQDGTWSIAPAYDLTFSAGPGGAHTMTIAGEGRAPTATHLLALAKKAGIRGGEAKEILSEVLQACADWTRHAEEARVAKRERDRIGKALTRVRPA